MPIITYALSKTVVWNERRQAISFFKTHKDSYGDFYKCLADEDKRFFSDIDMSKLSKETLRHISDVACQYHGDFDDLALKAQWTALERCGFDRFEEMLPVFIFDR